MDCKARGETAMKSNDQIAWGVVKVVVALAFLCWLMVTNNHDRDENIRALERITDVLEKVCR